MTGDSHRAAGRCPGCIVLLQALTAFLIMRELQMNVVPRARLALHADLAGVLLDDAVGDGQAQPVPPLSPVFGLVLVVKNGS